MKKTRSLLTLAALLVLGLAPGFGAEIPVEPPRITEFLTEQPSLTRAGRELTVMAVVENPGAEPIQIVPQLVVPPTIRPVKPLQGESPIIAPDQSVVCRWTISAPEPVYAELKVEIRIVSGKNAEDVSPVAAVRRLPVRFIEKREVTPVAEIPAPIRPERTSNLLVGVHNCPLWNADSYERWSQLGKHPERTPALGFYNQQLPEVADWETKWAVEHGVDFFIYCWYRTEQGGPVKTKFAEALHEALFKSRFQNEMKFTIMWENQSKGKAGVSDEADLLNNLFPYWMENYFKRANYLKIDNKPLLFIYRPEFLINDLGGVEQVKSALDKLRDASKKEGFDGLILLGEYRGTDPKQFQLLKELGLDSSFSYCWGIPNSPAPDEAIQRQMNYVEIIQNLGILPQVVTASQAWSGWRDEGSIWKLPPEEFEILLRQMKTFAETKIPADELGSRMIILDNWNEWGEGHYLLPYTEYGFGYLEAIANVFTQRTEPHEDLIPGDLGKGDYDAPYRRWLEEERNRPTTPDTWDFADSAQGWGSMMGNGTFATADGKLLVESNTKDPAIVVKFKKAKRASRFSKLRVRMKFSGLDTPSATAQLLWTGQASEDWSEAKSLKIPVIAGDQFHDYVFPLATSAAWSGKIAGLRFDYASQPGVRVEIEEIALEK